MAEFDESRRDFVRKAAYIAPLIISLKAAPSIARAGSGRGEPHPDPGGGHGEPGPDPPRDPPRPGGHEKPRDEQKPPKPTDRPPRPRPPGAR